jgi:hypothetical protein
MSLRDDFFVDPSIDFRRKAARFLNELKTYMIDPMREAGNNFEDSSDD